MTPARTPGLAPWWRPGDGDGVEPWHRGCWSSTTAPDVVLLDVQLPDLDGSAVAEALAGEPAAPVVVLVPSRALHDHGHRVDAGTARGCIAKADLGARHCCA